MDYAPCALFPCKHLSFDSFVAQNGDVVLKSCKITNKKFALSE